MQTLQHSLASNNLLCLVASFSQQPNWKKSLQIVLIFENAEMFWSVADLDYLSGRLLLCQLKQVGEVVLKIPALNFKSLIVNA